MKIKLTKFSYFSLSVFILLLSPVLSMAQVEGQIGNIIYGISGWVSTLIPIVMAIAVLVFFWGIVSYMTAGADEEKRGAARNLMIYGVIGLFVMVSIWGLVKFLGTTFGITQGGGVEAVKLPGTI